LGSLEGDTVKIQKFKKKPKTEKSKKEAPHKSLTQTWGL
jgi:hypothetical protein